MLHHESLIGDERGPASDLGGESVNDFAIGLTEFVKLSFVGVGGFGSHFTLSGPFYMLESMAWWWGPSGVRGHYYQAISRRPFPMGTLPLPPPLDAVVGDQVSTIMGFCIEQVAVWDPGCAPTITITIGWG